MPAFPRPLAVWILATGLVAAIPEVAVRGAVTLVSGSGPTGQITVRDQGAATTSADGRFLIFLGTGDAGGSQRVSLYRRTLASGATEQVVVPSGDAVTAYTASLDGSRVAFTCAVSTVTPAGQSPFRTHVFLKDFDTGELRLVTADPGGLPGDADSGGPVLSSDGRRILLESRASNLVADPDDNQAADVFLYEVDTGNLRLLSRAPDGTVGDEKSGSVALNDDGSVVVFRSDATNLRPAEEGLSTDLYVWSADTQTSRRIHLTGTTPGAARPDARAFNVVLTPDGHRLAFRSDAHSMSPAHGVWWFDLEAWSRRRVSDSLEVPVSGDDTGGPVMAAGGNRLAFETLSSPGKIVIWDADTGLHTLDELAILELPDGGAPANCRSPVLSPGGEWLALLTDSPVPAAGVVDSGDFRLYVRRLLTGETWTPLPGERRLFEMPFVEFVTGDGIYFQSDTLLSGIGDANRGLDVVEVSGPGESGHLLTPSISGMASLAGNAASNLGPGAVSLDGRSVIFTSTADNLVTGDTNGREDVFVRDLTSGTTRRVSVRNDGGEANSDSWTPRISVNGRFVVFMSTATNLADGDTNAAPDIYVRDLVSGTTVLASARDGEMVGSASARNSVNPVISADGRYVAFESDAVDLVPGISLGLGGNNVFLRDLVEQRTRLLSVNQPARILQGRARNPMMSDDGETVAFVAGNFSQADLYLYSVAENWLVAASAGEFVNFNVGGAALSADGTRAVYFRNRFGTGLWQRNNRTGIASALTGLDQLTDIAEVAVSGDGRRAAFVSRFQPEGSSDTNGLRDVFVVDLDTGALRPASAPAGGGAANGPSDSPVFSADGRRIAFRTQAGNLDGDAPAGSWNIVVRDLDTDLVTLVSRRHSDGLPGEESSGRPLLTANGLGVLFQSGAPLAPGDGNGVIDVFFAPFPGSATADVDNDSMPDVWERTHFGNLGRDGSADYDRDGALDRDEYAAGTSPILAGSVFHITTVPAEETGLMAITFPSVVGMNYRLEVAPILSGAGFSAVGAPVSGTGEPLRFAVPVVEGSAFVRVAAFR